MSVLLRGLHLIKLRPHRRPIRRRRVIAMQSASHLEVAIRAAKAAGDIISEAFWKPKTVHNKGQADLVTETDKECEKLIKEIVSQSFPTYSFIGEESAWVTDKVELTDDPTWMCDPLDGTTNFVHQYPSSCVSLALWIHREPVVGVVFNPVMGELFSAEKGKGALLNGKPISTSGTTEMEQAVFATELGVDRNPEVISAIMQRIGGLAAVTRSLRCGGSLALDLCHVACGRLDFCYEIGFGGCWDVGAGALIVLEAGGKVLDPRGGPFGILSRRVLGTNAYLDESVSKILASFDFYKDEPKP